MKKRKEKKVKSFLLVVRISVPEFFLGEYEWSVMSQKVRWIECVGRDAEGERGGDQTIVIFV